MGRCGCGWLDQARELEGGVRVASGVIVEGIVVCVVYVFRWRLVGDRSVIVIACEDMQLVYAL